MERTKCPKTSPSQLIYWAICGRRHGATFWISPSLTQAKFLSMSHQKWTSRATRQRKCSRNPTNFSPGLVWFRCRRNSGVSRSSRSLPAERWSVTHPHGTFATERISGNLKKNVCDYVIFVVTCICLKHQALYASQHGRFDYSSPWNGTHPILFAVQKSAESFPTRCQSWFPRSSWSVKLNTSLRYAQLSNSEIYMIYRWYTGFVCSNPQTFEGNRLIGSENHWRRWSHYQCSILYGSGEVGLLSVRLYHGQVALGCFRWHSFIVWLQLPLVEIKGELPRNPLTSPAFRERFWSRCKISHCC